jgi:hypothetical protein
MLRSVASPSPSPFAPGLARIALIALLTVAPGCKSMGGVMSGLGKATAVAAHGAAHAGGAIASGAARAAPSVLRATEAVVETAVEIAWESLPPAIDIEIGPEGVPPPSSRPGDDDPCQACSLDDCGVCVGYAGYACVASPAGAIAHCESSAPPDAPPAPAPPPAPPTAAAAGSFQFQF